MSTFQVIRTYFLLSLSLNTVALCEYSAQDSSISLNVNHEHYTLTLQSESVNNTFLRISELKKATTYPINFRENTLESFMHSLWINYKLSLILDDKIPNQKRLKQSLFNKPDLKDVNDLVNHLNSNVSVYGPLWSSEAVALYLLMNAFPEEKLAQQAQDGLKFFLRSNMLCGNWSESHEHTTLWATKYIDNQAPIQVQALYYYCQAKSGSYVSYVEEKLMRDMSSYTVVQRLDAQHSQVRDKALTKAKYLTKKYQYAMIAKYLDNDDYQHEMITSNNGMIASEKDLLKIFHLHMMSLSYCTLSFAEDVNAYHYLYVKNHLQNHKKHADWAFIIELAMIVDYLPQDMKIQIYDQNQNLMTTLDYKDLGFIKSNPASVDKLIQRK